LCAGVLEFCKNPDTVIEVLARHLKPRGILVILFPNFSVLSLFYKLYHETHKIKIKLFTEHQMKKKLLSNKFKIVKIIHATSFSCIIKAQKL